MSLSLYSILRVDRIVKKMFKVAIETTSVGLSTKLYPNVRSTQVQISTPRTMLCPSLVQTVAFVCVLVWYPLPNFWHLSAGLWVVLGWCLSVTMQIFRQPSTKFSQVSKDLQSTSELSLRILHTCVS